MSYPALRVWRCAPLTLAIALTLLSHGGRVRAAITSTGDVSPVPPVIGTLPGDTAFGQFKIGITSTGNVNFGQGTSLTSTGKTILGDTETGIGTVVMNGLGTAWKSVDVTVGELGAGFHVPDRTGQNDRRPIRHHWFQGGLAGLGHHHGAGQGVG